MRDDTPTTPTTELPPAEASLKAGFTPYGHHADSLFQECPQKYQYALRRNLSTQGYSTPLVAGSALHAGLHVYHHPSTKGDASLKFLQATIAAEKIMDEVPHAARTFDGENWWDMMHFDVLRMLRGYADTYGDPAHTPWIVRGLEEDFDIEVPTPRILDKDGKPILVRMTGRWDGLIELTEGPAAGALVTLEHKTTSDELDVMVRRYRLDAQNARYCIAAEHKHSKRVRGVMLNIVKKPKGTRKPMYKRQLITYTDEELAHHLDEIAVIRIQQSICDQTGIWPRNGQWFTGSCYRNYRWCEFWSLCAYGESMGALAEFRPPITEPTDEPKE